MIRLDKLTIGYGKRHLIEGATLSLEAGGLVALIGRNGAGKSTLLRTLCGLELPIEGTVCLNGHALSEISPEQLSKTVAFVATERVRIANMRCEDVVALGRAPYTNWIGRLQDEDRQIVAEALRSVGMSDFAARTMDRMSDGECQRIMIARALAQQTPVILLDEPTSFLDLPNRYELVTLLSTLAHDKGKCILFSTHELDIALSLCDSVMLIDSPHLHAMPAQEMIRSGHIDRLFGNDRIRFDSEMGSLKILKR